MIALPATMSSESPAKISAGRPKIIILQGGNLHFLLKNLRLCKADSKRTRNGVQEMLCIHHFQCKIHHFQCKIHYFQRKMHHVQCKIHHFSPSRRPTSSSRPSSPPAPPARARLWQIIRNYYPQLLPAIIRNYEGLTILFNGRIFIIVLLKNHDFSI